MEDNGILDIDNESDIFCLHFVSTDLLQRTLSGFQMAWNNHRLRTEKNMSPNMLYAAGLAQLSKMQDQQSNEYVFTELVQNVGGCNPNNDDEESLEVHREVDLDCDGTMYEPPLTIRHHTEVPLYRCPLNDAGMAALRSHINPQTVELNNLVDSFIRVKMIVTNLLLS